MFHTLMYAVESIIKCLHLPINHDLSYSLYLARVFFFFNSLYRNVFSYHIQLRIWQVYRCVNDFEFQIAVFLLIFIEKRKKKCLWKKEKNQSQNEVLSISSGILNHDGDERKIYKNWINEQFLNQNRLSHRFCRINDHDHTQFILYEIPSEKKYGKTRTFAMMIGGKKIT